MKILVEGKAYNTKIWGIHDTTMIDMATMLVVRVIQKTVVFKICFPAAEGVDVAGPDPD